MAARKPVTLEMLHSKARALLERPEHMVVRIVASLTIDYESTDDVQTAEIADPALGGTALFALDALERCDRESDIRLYGKRCERCKDGDGALRSRLFYDLVEESKHRDKILELVEDAGWQVPQSVHFARSDGVRHLIQQDDNTLRWDDPSLVGLFNEDEPGVLFLGGIWRYGLYRGLAEKLEALQKEGWIIALHPGNIDPRKPLGWLPGIFEQLREALPFIDILFSQPAGLLRLVGELDDADLGREIPTVEPFLFADQPWFGKLPPIVALYRGYLDLELLAPGIKKRLRVESPCREDEDHRPPTGLRTCSIATLLFELVRTLADAFWAQREMEAGDAVKRLGDCLQRSGESALNLHRPRLTVTRKLKAQLIDREYPECTLYQIPELDPLSRVIVGDSEPTRNTRREVRTLARTDLKVLIVGESGSGKEVVARQIHTLSCRRSGPFVAVNCATLSAGIMESELFGHVKGAFTDAKTDSVGLIESVHGGTLFLDEIAELIPDAQAKLLRFVEGKSFRRVGGVEEMRPDVRILAATNKDLEQAVKNNLFRADLYHRLNESRIQIPPLRDRLADIERLVPHFAERLTFDHGAIRVLKTYDWPGNVRELRNFVVRTEAVDSSPTISSATAKDHLSHWRNRYPSVSGNLEPLKATECFWRLHVCPLFQRVRPNDARTYLRILDPFVRNPQAELSPQDFERQGLGRVSNFLRRLRKLRVLEGADKQHSRLTEESRKKLLEMRDEARCHDSTTALSTHP